MGPTPESGKEGSSGSSGSQDTKLQSSLISKKRSRPEGGIEVTDGGAGARAFSLPPCFVEKDFFEGFPLSVSDNETDIIRRLNKEGRRKHLAASMIRVVKMDEMEIILAGEGSDSLDQVKELESEKAALVAKSRKLKAALERFEEMFWEQFDVLSGEKERTDRALEEKDCLQLDKEQLESDNQRLLREVEDLKAVMLSSEDDPEGVADLRTCADFIARIQILESDCVGALADGFESAVNQLSMLNPGLNTEGTGVLSQVVNGRVVPPPDSPDVDVGTPRSD